MTSVRTAVLVPYQNPEALQGRTVFNTYLWTGCSERKIEENEQHFIFHLGPSYILQFLHFSLVIVCLCYVLPNMH